MAGMVGAMEGWMDGWRMSDEVMVWARCLLQILERN